MSNAQSFFTPAQMEASRKILELLNEHFDAYVLVVETEIDSTDPNLDQSTFWIGAHQHNSAAIGLMEKYRHKLLNTREEG